MNLSALVCAGEQYEPLVAVAVVQLGVMPAVSQEDCVLSDTVLSQVVEAARRAMGESTELQRIDLLYQADGVPVREEEWCIEKFNRLEESRKLKLETGQTWCQQWRTPHNAVVVITPRAG